MIVQNEELYSLPAVFGRRRFFFFRSVWIVYFVHSLVKGDVILPLFQRLLFRQIVTIVTTKRMFK